MERRDWMYWKVSLRAEAMLASMSDSFWTRYGST